MAGQGQSGSCSVAGKIDCGDPDPVYRVGVGPNGPGHAYDLPPISAITKVSMA